MPAARLPFRRYKHDYSEYMASERLHILLPDICSRALLMPLFLGNTATRLLTIRLVSQLYA